MKDFLRLSNYKFIFLFAFIIITSLSASAQTVRVFSTSGTFTVPACVTSLTVECWGAGGGGGGAVAASGGAAGSGGGGGGYAIATLTNVSGTYTVTVGTGGAGGNGAVVGSINGVNGGNSIFTNGTVTVTGVGGTGGTGLQTAGVGTTVGQGGGGTFVGVTGSTYKGGNGALGNNQDNNTGGAGGGGAGSSGNGVTPAQTGDDANGTGGSGGPGNPNGAGGSVSAAYYENGGPGYSIGGGGAGGGGETSGGIFGHGTATGNGGQGGDGEVIVTYSLSTPTITSVAGTGCPGSTITINGTLLGGATSVKVGTTAVTNLSITSTVITGTIAAGTTSGVVTVVTPCGTVTSAASFNVHPAIAVNLGTHSICSGSYSFGGHTYTTSGTYADTVPSTVTGCDSVTSITLTIGNTINRAVSQTVCDGGTYTFGGHTYSISGTYADTTTSVVTGCDSITTLTLLISPPLNTPIAQSICGDQGYNFAGQTLYRTGVYSDTTTSVVSGCDSITTLTLTVVPAPRSITNGYICNRTNYTWNGTSYSTPGLYYDTLLAAGSNGCDSIAILNLGVANTFGEAVTVSAVPPMICNGDTAQVCASTGFASYLWSTTDTGTCIYATIANNYAVTATDTFGCTVTSDVNIAAFTSVAPTIQKNGDTLFCSPEPSYQWYFNTQAVTGDTFNNTLAIQPGQYTVDVVDTNGCANKAVYDITTGVINAQTEAAITVYPNPLTNGKWSINVSQNLVGSSYQLFDAAGRSVFKSTINNTHFEVAPPVAAGVYILQINSADGNYELKLVKGE